MAWLYPPILCGLFVAPYALDVWWKFLAATVAVLVWTRVCHGRNAWDMLGLRARPDHLAVAAVLLVVVGLAGRWLIQEAAASAGMVLRSDLWPLPWRFLAIFQALNEEIVFRSLLLGLLVRRFGRPLLLSLLASGIFAIAHLGFYGIAHGLWLAPTALGTLFLFGLATNWLFVRTGHVWFGHALHAGWNLTRFGGDFLGPGNQVVAEGATFNAIEGAWSVLGFSAVVLMAAAVLSWRAIRAAQGRPLPSGPA